MEQIDYSQIATLVAAQIQTAQAQKAASEDWKDALDKDSKGNIKNSIDNYIAFLNNHPKYKEAFKYNEFLEQKEIHGKMFSDFDEAIIYNDCERECGLSTKTKVDNALMEVFNSNRYNPILNYITSLKWDGKKRISKLFIDLLQADNTELNKEMTKKWFIAAVKRIVEPGCKFDNMIVLQGNQGIGKSSICELISKSFCNTISLDEVGNKDLIGKLNRTWIAVIDEMDTFNKKEMSSIKTFLSLSEETTRLAWAKNQQTYKRHCVFIGSTNDETFLRDSTSSIERRFWIIKCNKTKMDGKIRETLTSDYIDQLWAEAYHYYVEDPKQYLDISQELQKTFADTMQEFKIYNNDTVIDNINEILDKKYTLTNGFFTSYQDFYNQFTETVQYGSGAHTLTKMPMNWLCNALKSYYHEERSAKYIAQALSAEWDYKVIFIHGKSIRGLVRKSEETLEASQLISADPEQLFKF